MDRKAALLHERRQRIHDFIETNPGVRFHELKRDLDLPHGALIHHLRVLRVHGLVVFVREGRRLRLRTTGAQVPLRLETEAQDVLAMVDARPGLSVKDLCDALGWTRRKAVYWAQHLAREGKVLAQRDAGRTRLHLVRPDDSITLTPLGA